MAPNNEPPEGDEDSLNAARGLVHGLLGSLLLWAVLLVATCSAIALILPGKPAPSTVTTQGAKP